MTIKTDPLGALSSGCIVGDVATTFSDTFATDPFGRKRTTGTPFTVFYSKQVFDDDTKSASDEHFPLFFDNVQTTGAGTSSIFSIERASTTLLVAASTAGTRVRQSKQCINYQSGKGQMAVFTGITASGSTSDGVTKRWGLFNDNNGVFFQAAGSIISVVQRSNVSGCVSSSVIAQTDWNIDKFDGKGKSGFTLTASFAQIFFVDFEWLGVGRIRYGLFINGLPFFVHEQHNANSMTSAWSSDPNAPVRFEIANDGNGDADGLEMMCVAISSEGGIQPQGSVRNPDPKDAIVNTINANTAGSTYVVAGMKLKDGHINHQVDIINVNLLSISQGDVAWSIYLNPTMTASLTYADINDSPIQYAFGSNANPGETITDPGHALIGGLMTGNDALAQFPITQLRLGATIAGSSDEVVLGVTPRTNNQDIFGFLQWQEAW